MKINLTPPPGRLQFGSGDDAFALILRPVTAYDRMDITDGFGQGLAAGYRAIENLVIGWEGVLAPDGSPLVFEGIRPDGTTGKNLAAVLGQLPLAMHVQVLTAILAHAGMRDDANTLSKVLLGRDKAQVVQTDPTTSAPAAPAGSISGAS